MTTKTQYIQPQRGWLETADGLRLHRESQIPANPKAAMLFVHGFADHCGRYAAMADDFVEQGYACFRYDYRGHGRSDGKRGHIFAFDDYLTDLRAARAWFEAESADLPRFILAHSNGGLIALHGVSQQPEGLTGLVLSSPFFGFGVKVPALKAWAGRLSSRLLPAFSQATNLDAALVSHDPTIVHGYAVDPLIGRVASSRWYTETVAAHAGCPAAAQALTLPVLMQQAGDDRIVSAPIGREVYEQIASGDKTLKVYDGLFHEIWFELERGPVIADLGAWLTDHLPAS